MTTTWRKRLMGSARIAPIVPGCAPPTSTVLLIAFHDAWVRFSSRTNCVLTVTTKE
jgi:hypothetical protein